MSKKEAHARRSKEYRDRAKEKQLQRKTKYRAKTKQIKQLEAELTGLHEMNKVKWPEHYGSDDNGHAKYMSKYSRL